MKNLLSLALVILLSLGAAGCTCGSSNQGNTNTGGNQGNTSGNQGTTTSGNYKDGTYTGKGDPWEFGSEEAVVEVKNGKIASINLKRLDKNGTEVNYEDWKGQEVNGKVYPNLKQYRIDMANKMIEKQSSEADTISGATVSTKNWKVAVDRALQQAKK
ncbi:FMN-binding protein [Clostridium polynesiense]|uniref:FMN-binding protein n=1 Tax=Clostridium polynesiense TaxID=1325933 RepID=UPI00058AC268|nr:FMN-binding protein [Clostridium polynesiense]